MGFDNRYEGIDEYAVRIIKHKARQLVGRAGFTESDREDLEQEMMLDLLRRLPKYNPDRAQRNTFIARIVEHKVATIIETRKAGMRDYRLCTCSLNDRLEDDEGGSIERLETIDQEEYLRRTGKLSRPAAELRDLSIDLGRVIASLPPGAAHPVPAPSDGKRDRDLPRHRHPAGNDLRVHQETARHLRGRRPPGLPVIAADGPGSPPVGKERVRETGRRQAARIPGPGRPSHEPQATGTEAKS